VPRHPRAWLVRTGRNRAIDVLRRRRALDRRLANLEVAEAREDDVDELDETAIPDERLELIFACCHPALATEAQVALTLRTLGGLDTEDVARAFLVAPETMKRRLSRAKAKIAAAGIRSTGTRSPCSTPSWPRGPARRSSSSTGPSPSPRRARRRRRRRSPTRSPRTSTATATCTRRAPSCCGGSAAARRRAARSTARWRSPRTARSGGCWSAAAPE